MFGGHGRRPEDDERAELNESDRAELAQLRAERDARDAGDTADDDGRPVGDGPRELHDADDELAPVFAYEHPGSGKLVLHESGALDPATGQAVNREDVPEASPRELHV